MKLYNSFIRPTSKLLIFYLLFCAAANGQMNTMKLAEQMKNYSKSVLQEKLYMHVDRNFYLAGEIVWCKLYVVDATFHQPLDLSKLAYVEVLDQNNISVLQAKMSLNKGRGKGSISIPITIHSGNYKIRAYTNWMKNAGADYFFEKKITIVNTLKSRESFANSTKQVSPPDIHFFPEGGNLVSGITSKIACRVQGADGKGMIFKGTILDEKNDTVTSFSSYKFGMGNFTFTPQAGHRYKAVVETGGERYAPSLPEIFNQGYVMQLNTDEHGSPAISVQTNIINAEQVFLLIHTRQLVKIIKQAGIENGKALFPLDTAKLGEGISHITVFNGSGIPVCERLFFKQPTHQLSINISGNLGVYATRSKVELAVRPLDTNGKDPDADLSAAIYRLDELQNIDEANIFSYLWLSSDLKGTIESPRFYFEGNPTETGPDMENLLLTQGWRRFKWSDILQDKIPSLSYIPEINGHIINAKAVSSKTGQPMQDVETYVTVPGLNGNFRVFISDTTGKLKFDFESMKGSSEIIVLTNPNVDSSIHIEVANPFFESYSATKLSPFYLSKSNEHLLLDQSIGVQAQQIYSGMRMKNFIQSTDTTSLFTKPDNVYFMDDYTRFTTMEEVLREYVGQMDVQKQKGKFSLKLYDHFFVPIADMAKRRFFDSDPLILVDGMPVFSVDKLMGFDPMKMRKLEVYNHRYFMGNSFFSGIMNFTTYKGDMANYELDPRAMVIDYEGLQLDREFYSPMYDTNINSHIPDFRTLLYWAPMLNPEKDGQRHLRFYTSDKKGIFVAVIQGLSKEGECGSTIMKFEVK